MTLPLDLNNTLQQQVDSNRQTIHATSLTMSIGELANMYKDGDIEIHPAFQRSFRWDDQRKSNLVESLLLGIPIPPIFVQQRPDGVWEVIDGVQRLSTVFELQGLLHKTDAEYLPPLELLSTAYLPALEKHVWSNPDSHQKQLPEPLKRILRRSMFDITIVTRESDSKTKFDLFRRLNSGGEALSDQEIRNAILVMINPEAATKLISISKNEDFQDLIRMSDKNLEQKYDQELALRFIALYSLKEKSLGKIRDLNEFLTDASEAMAENYPSGVTEGEEVFERTFSILGAAFPDRNCFRRFDTDRSTYTGGFLVSAFEAVSLGIAANLQTWESNPEELLRQRVQSMWQEPDFRDNARGGVRANTRIRKIIPFAREFFA